MDEHKKLGKDHGLYQDEHSSTDLLGIKMWLIVVSNAYLVVILALQKVLQRILKLYSELVMRWNCELCSADACDCNRLWYTKVDGASVCMMIVGFVFIARGAVGGV